MAKAKTRYAASLRRFQLQRLCEFSDGVEDVLERKVQP
jgi:hypothetical protein